MDEIVMPRSYRLTLSSYGCGKTGITRFAACLQSEMDQMQKIDYQKENGDLSIDRTASHLLTMHPGISLFSMHPGEIETSLHTTGFPEKTHREAPYIIDHMKALDQTRPHYDISLPAWTCVYLVSGKAAKLRGKYVDCTRDIGEVIEQWS